MIRFIGDIHNDYDAYYTIANQSEYSIQLGDFGDSAYVKLFYSNLNHNKHRVLSGNHCDYDVAPDIPHYLGDFGNLSLDNRSIYFVRGGLSVDRTYRNGEHLSGGKKTYWTQEELNFDQMLNCMEDYDLSRAEILIAHVPPSFLIDDLHPKGHKFIQQFGFHEGFQENTSLLISKLIGMHRPKVCLFGHHHVHYVNEIDGTLYIGLGINDYIDL